MRVLEFVSRPGMGVCGNGMHSHPAHLTVALSEAKVRVTLPDGRASTRQQARRRVLERSRNARGGEHRGRDLRALIIEIKDAPKARG